MNIFINIFCISRFAPIPISNRLDYISLMNYLKVELASLFFKLFFFNFCTSLATSVCFSGIFIVCLKSIYKIKPMLFDLSITFPSICSNLFFKLEYYISYIFCFNREYVWVLCVSLCKWVSIPGQYFFHFLAPHNSLHYSKCLQCLPLSLYLIKFLPSLVLE